MADRRRRSQTSSARRSTGSTRTRSKTNNARRAGTKTNTARTTQTARKQTARKQPAKTQSRKKRTSGTGEIRAISSSQNLPLQQNLGDSYYNLIFGTIILIIFGLLTVYIADSSVSGLLVSFGFATGGVLIMIFFVGRLGTVIYKKLAPLTWLGSIAMIALLKTPLGISVNGATRWLNLFGISVQVVEFVKVGTIITCAWLLNKYYKDMIAPGVYALVWGAAGILAALIIKISSDLSSGLVILLIAYVMTFVVMKHVIWHIIVAITGVSGFYIVYVRPAIELFNAKTVSEIKEMHAADEIPYRVERILGWLHPDAFRQDLAYQTAQSVRAIGSAGFLGKGLGSTLGTENFFAIESDFILAQLTSSFGILGLIGVLGLFLFLVLNIIFTAMNSRDRLFESLLCTGIATHFLFQNLINFCVATGAFPNTGIPFIFLSSGTTGLLVNCAEIGMVLAINVNTAKRLHDKGLLH